MSTKYTETAQTLARRYVVARLASDEANAVQDQAAKEMDSVASELRFRKTPIIVQHKGSVYVVDIDDNDIISSKLVDKARIFLGDVSLDK